MKHVIIALILCMAVVAGCSTKAPVVGAENGLLATCAGLSDCVSTESTDPEQQIAPFQAHGETEKVMVDIATSVESIFGGKVLLVEGNYLHAEFKSSVLRTMDDAEFLYDERAGLVQIRAFSRGEPLDFPDNRNRIEELRQIFAKTQ